MNLEGLVSQIRQHGGTLYLEEQRLKFRGPGSLLTPRLRSVLTNHKDELVALLTQEGAISSLTEHAIPPAAHRDYLAPYTQLIEAAGRGELPSGKTIRLSPWETTQNLNRAVLAAVEYIHFALSEDRRQQQFWQNVASAKSELLERCRLAAISSGETHLASLKGNWGDT